MRPVVLNYGTPSTSDNVYVFYGGNDGVFRAVKGGQAATDGKEVWGFIPKEFYGKFLRLYNNSPAVLYPSTPNGLTPTPQKRDYFWDGPVGSYVARDSTGAVTQAILYVTARRGGRFIYAIDVTTVTAPKLLWRKGCTTTDDATCDSGFAELGQTWSLPQVATVHDGTTAGKKVVIFGAGYDTAEDNEASPPSQDTKGRAVYVLDALTGDLLWSGGVSTGAPASASANIQFSVSADVLVVDRNSDGFADRLYVADIGGNLWRADINDSDMSNWRMWHIASVSDRGSPATTRKFLFGPDVVFGDNFDAVVIGTGDREHPLAGGNAATAQNRVYMFEDPNTGFTGADLGSGGGGLTNSDLADVTSSTTVGPDKKGWFMDLATGEKVINGPLVLLSGNMVFGTNTPNPDNSCTGNLGDAKRYDINFLNGAAATNGLTDAQGNPVRSQDVEGGGFLPSPVEGVVEINGQRYMFAIDNPLSGPPIPNTVVVTHKRFRTYWHEILE
jgi:type IV pilus assembly protein PilY1